MNTTGPERLSWLGIGLICGATAVLCIVVALGRWQVGVGGEWVWAYTRNAFWERAWAPCCYFALLAAVLWVASARRQITAWETALLLAILVAFAFGLQLSMGQLGPAGTYEGVFATLGPWMGGYHSEALKAHGLMRYLVAYPETIGAMSVKGLLAHVSNHPPGYIVFYWAMDKATAASPLLAEAIRHAAGYLTPVEADLAKGLTIALSPAQEAGVWLSCFALQFIVCLTIVPVFLLARRTTRQVVPALAAAAFTALVPAFHLFSPYPDATIIFLAPWVIYFWDKALDGRPILFGLLAGAAFFAATFFSLAVLVLGPMAFAVAAVRWFQPERRKDLLKNAAKAVASGAGMFLLITLVIWVTTGCNLPRIFLVCFHKHSEFYASVQRSYWPWLFWNIADFVLFLGVPVAVLAMWGLVGSVAAGRERIMEGRIVIAAFATLMVLDVMGLNRGETGRLWMVFMPFFCTGVALVACNQCRNGARTLILLAAQFAQVCLFKLSLDVFGLVSK